MLDQYLMHHFLIVGFNNSSHHVDYALKNNIKLSLIIEKKKHKAEFDQFFEKVYQVDDLYDFAKIKKVLELDKENFTNVLTRFENYLSVVGALNDYLGLDGFSYQTARNFGNKYLMKKKWQDKQIPCADGICMDNVTPQELDNFIAEHPFPLILKKASGTHSSFVYKVESKKDLEKKLHIFNSLGAEYKISKPLRNYQDQIEECNLILEEMLTGTEVSIDSFVSQGKITHTPICKYVLAHEIGVEGKYLPIRLIPGDFSPAAKQKLFEATEKALKVLGAHNCVCHTELFYDEKTNQCWLIESTARGGGNRSEMINYATDQNYDAAIIKATQGEEIPTFVANGQALAVIECFAEFEGEVTEINLDFIDRTPKAKIFKQRAKVGFLAKPAAVGGKNLLIAHLEGKDLKQLRTDSIKLFKQIKNGFKIKRINN